MRGIIIAENLKLIEVGGLEDVGSEGGGKTDSLSFL